jgi:hypothetical protein
LVRVKDLMKVRNEA